MSATTFPLHCSSALISLPMPIFPSPRTIEELLQPTPFVLDADRVNAYLANSGTKIEELLLALIPFAKKYAIAPISNYHVGAAALGESGRIYLGVNLEFEDNQLNSAVHGEQFICVNVRNYQDKIKILAVSAAPCGHCRQFLNEIGKDSHDMQILIPNHPPISISELLPHAFGPQDLGVEGGLLTVPIIKNFSLHDKINEAAVKSARTAYAPYSKSYSGVAIEVKTGEIFTGCNLDNAAFNPSLPPMQSALVALVAGEKKWSDIKTVVLCQYFSKQTKICHKAATTTLLKAIQSEVSFITIGIG